MRAVMVVILLALVCRWGVAQIGPKYVIELRGQGGAATAGMAQGRVQLVGHGLALVRFQGLSLLVVDADGEAYSEDAARAWPEADLLLVLPASAGHYAGIAPLQALRNGAPVIVGEVDAAPVSAGGPQLYPMQVWNALDLRKQNTRLRVTAMAGGAGAAAIAGYMLEMGNSRSSYRLYVSAAEAAAAELAQRMPGADLALVAGPSLLRLNRGAPSGAPAALTAAGYAFTAIKR